MRPDITAVQRRVRAADRGFRACVCGGPGAPPQCRALAATDAGRRSQPGLRPTAWRQIETLQLATATRIARSYLADDAAATFRVIVDPLVTWIWIGGLIALAGALIALWPARRGRAAASPPTPSWRRRRKPSTARSATPSSTTPPASSPTRTSPCSTPSCASEAVEILDRGNGSDNGHRAEADRPTEPV